MKVTCAFPEFSEWEIGIVKRIAGLMTKNGSFNSSDREDLEQELLVHLWKKREDFSPDREPRCSYESYIRKILNKKRTDLIRKKLFQLRQAGCESVDFDNGSSDSQGNLQPRKISLLPRREFNLEKDVILKDEIRRILRGLGVQKRQICVFLSEGHQPDDIAAKMNISTYTVYNHIKQLREIFENEGLNANFN